MEEFQFVKSLCIIPFWVVVMFNFCSVCSSKMCIIPKENAIQKMIKVQTSAIMSLMTLVMLITMGPNVS